MDEFIGSEAQQKLYDESAKARTFEALNGTVKYGDKIAYCASNARYGSGMRIAFVEEITGTPEHPRLQVLVMKSSGIAGQRWNRKEGHWEEKPYLKTIDGCTLKTVVKLNDTFRSDGSDD